MTAIQLCLTLSALCTSVVNGVGEQAPKSAVTYGNATVTTVLRLDEHVRIFCNIAELPPIIGQNIPVQIKGLKPAADAKNNLKLLMFLNDLLLSKNNEPKQILLKDIQRGDQFCLVADIHIDGQNLCDLLIEKKLAQKVIEVPQPEKIESSPLPAANKDGYIASKSSKVYHRSTCPHAKRMNSAKAVMFNTREGAEQTGRRPCKTCKP
ncbi:MAG: Ada metal-binding domain-containing protein [Planctomycetota bacterium]